MSAAQPAVSKASIANIQTASRQQQGGYIGHNKISILMPQQKSTFVALHSRLVLKYKKSGQSPPGKNAPDVGTRHPVWRCAATAGLADNNKYRILLTKNARVEKRKKQRHVRGLYKIIASLAGACVETPTLNHPTSPCCRIHSQHPQSYAQHHGRPLGGK